MNAATVIQHVSFEDLDAFEAPLLEAGYHLDRFNAAEAIPEPSSLGTVLIILGGPISANHQRRYPFVRDELRLIEHQIQRGQPVLGICLGAQLIAKVLGARVYPQSEQEIGVAPLSLTQDGESSCLATFSETPQAFHWHGEAFDLPPGAKRLASTKLCENQAFSVGSNVVGFQFHPEMTGRNLEHWLVGHAAELGDARIEPETLRAQFRRHGASIARNAAAVATEWLSEMSA